MYTSEKQHGIQTTSTHPNFNAEGDNISDVDTEDRVDLVEHIDISDSEKIYNRAPQLEVTIDKTKDANMDIAINFPETNHHVDPYNFLRGYNEQTSNRPNHTPGDSRDMSYQQISHNVPNNTMDTTTEVAHNTYPISFNNPCIQSSSQSPLAMPLNSALALDKVTTFCFLLLQMTKLPPMNVK